MAEQTVNDHLVLVSGKSTTGKSMSLRGIQNPEGVMYLACESGKKLPFKAKFNVLTVTDPYQVYEGFTAAESMPEVHTIVIDSQTYLMDMFESVHVLPSADTMKAWGQYAQYFKNLMQQYVARSSKNVVFTAHTLDLYNEKNLSIETYVPVKGSLKNQGIESYFSVVISTKRMSLIALEPYKSPLLTITPAEERLGFKHVFQTQLTKDTVDERIRGPFELWDEQETFIDNNLQLVFDRLHTYYA